MFDFDAGKLLIIGVVALIVIGPKELPRVLRQVGQAVGRLKRMASEFQGQFMDAMKEADIQSIRDEVTKLSAESKLDMHFDPARDIQTELTRSIETTAPAALVEAELVEAPAAATDGFALPAPNATADEELPASAAGIAPVAEPVASEPATLSEAASFVRKRKIVLPKRGPRPAQARHAVSDRTALPRDRWARPRRDEATER